MGCRAGGSLQHPFAASNKVGPCLCPKGLWWDWDLPWLREDHAKLGHPPFTPSPALIVSLKVPSAGISFGGAKQYQENQGFFSLFFFLKSQWRFPLPSVE